MEHRQPGFLSITSIEHHEMEALRGWLSINAWRNIQLLLAGCESLGIDEEVVWSLLPNHLARKSTAQMRADEDQITLSEYDAVVKPLERVLGHIGWLRMIGRASPMIDFGLEALKRFVGTKLLGPFVTPWAAYSELNQAAAAWNTNKAWLAYRIAQNKVRLVCVYLPGGPQQKTVNRLQDAGSLLHLIRGMNEALPNIFPGRGLGKVSYRLIELPIVPLLEQWLPENMQADFDGRVLRVNNEVVGHQVWLTPDDNNQYVGEYAKTEISGAPVGILISSDIKTPCTRERNGISEMPIIYKGEIYQVNDTESPFGRSVIEVEWQITLADRILNLIPGSGLIARVRQHKFRGQVTDESRLIASVQVANVEARRARILEGVGQTVYPDTDFFKAILAGENPMVVDQDTVTLALDIKEFTSWCEQLSDPREIAQFMQPFMNAINAIIGRFGGKINNFTGDGCIATWSGSMGPSVIRSVSDRVQLAINAAQEIVAVADDIKMPARIGISSGQTITYAMQVDRTGLNTFPVTNGTAMNSAARVEGAAKQIPTNDPTTSVIGMDEKTLDLLLKDGRVIPPSVRRVGKITEKESTILLYEIKPNLGTTAKDLIPETTLTQLRAYRESTITPKPQ